MDNAQVRYLAPRELFFPTFIRIVRNIKCDLWLLNGVFPSLVLLLLIGRKLGLFDSYPIVLAPRGHLEQGALGLKSRKKRIFLSIAKAIGLYNNVRWLCASQSEKDDVIREFGTSVEQKVVVIGNTVNLIAKSNLEEQSAKVPGALKLVFLSRISQKKNLNFALRVLAHVSDSVQFDIYGPREDSVYWAQCEDAIRILPSNISVNYCGSLEPDEVVPTLTKYHLFFLPTFGENFGHAILEALCAGLPVLISNRTPWSEVNEYGAGWALPLDQIEPFRGAMEILINADAETLNAYRQRALNYARAYLSQSTATDEMRTFLYEVAASGRHT